MFTIADTQRIGRAYSVSEMAGYVVRMSVVRIAHKVLSKGAAVPVVILAAVLAFCVGCFLKKAEVQN